MEVFVKFWGTRGSIPTPGDRTRKYGGNTPCVELRVGETLFVLDAGSGIRELGADLTARGLKPIVAHLLLSHCHWDHVQGFPFFSPIYVPGNELFLYGARAFWKSYDVFYSLAKATSFGFVIPLVAVHFGFATAGGAEGVGRATTSAVVAMIVAILVLDAVFPPLLLGSS